MHRRLGEVEASCVGDVDGVRRCRAASGSCRVGTLAPSGEPILLSIGHIHHQPNSALAHPRTSLLSCLLMVHIPARTSGTGLSCGTIDLSLGLCTCLLPRSSRVEHPRCQVSAAPMRNKLAVSNGRLDDFDDDRYMKCFGWQGVWRLRGAVPPLLPWFAPNDDAPEESGHPVTKKTGNTGHVRLRHLRA
ncbi:hypothetical protein B0H10DRAFT_1957113 [Mycena sp. CBHHK59/15]|nr:hypothetical protein B0H10DRAFT_1957113 [Mycena sp. CBHHK59/15]